MKWFPGSINDAVTTAKQREAIFVVFVEGKDDSSIEAASVLNSEEISLRMNRDDFVAVRVETDTESFNFFKQIYKMVPVPSLFFIGTNGVPMDVIAGASSTTALSTRIDAVLAKFAKEKLESSSSSLIRAEQKVASSTSSSVEASEPEAGESSDGSKDQVAAAAAAAAAGTGAEEKIERAKQLMELQRRQKLEKEREEEKMREMERRQLGKDLQSLKQKQHEAEVKSALEERMREKAAASEAKERVRQQIAQDKMERKQREAALQREMANQQPQSQQERGETSGSNSSSDSTTARIQFRLPAGSPHTGKFEAASTLGSLRSYVSDNIELPFRRFSMSTTFPRRDLSVDDDDKTLAELELVPTAVILILPVKNAKVTTVVPSSDNIGFVSRFVWALFAPILSIYNYVMGYFAGGASGPAEARGGGESIAGSATGDRFGRIVDQPSGSSIGGNLSGGPSTAIRSRGNIHRLRSAGEDNDENNTWNGNSTQQM